MADLDKVIENIEGGILMARATDTKLVHMTVEHVEDVLELLKSQQAEIERLKAERKEGHWEVFTMCANEGTYCSECHTKIFDFVTPPKRKLSMFCPHCGAKMSEERISR